MIQTSDSIKAISAALLQFQGLVDGVKRDGKNPHFRRNYATLENVIDTARPALQECGISFVQAPGAIVDGSLEVTTRLTHAESGEWMQSTMHMPLGKRDPQGAGSATTYGLRYSLMAMLGLPPTDDDGEAAMDRSPRSLSAAAAPKAIETQYGEVDPDWRPDGNQQSSAELKRQKIMAEFETELTEVHSLVSLEKFKSAWRAKAKAERFNDAFLAAMKDRLEAHERSIMSMMDVEALAEVPLKDALRASTLNAG